MKGRRQLVLITVIAVLSVFMLAGFAHSQLNDTLPSKGQGPALQASIEAEVLSQVRDAGKATYWVVLREQPTHPR